MNFRRHSLRRWFLITIVTMACLIALTLVLLSPLALAWLKNLNRNWLQLSNMGQTYGAISALISSLALGGVVVSLIYQARDLRTTRNQGIRSFQHHLIEMEMADPTLMTAMGAPWNLPIPAENEKIREHLYIHMWVSFWAGNYFLGELTDKGVRSLVKSELFGSNAGRRYWAAIRTNVIANSTGKYYRFCQIIDAAYNEVIASNVPVGAPVKVTDPANNTASLRGKKLLYSLPTCVALTVGILTGLKLNRRPNKEL